MEDLFKVSNVYKTQYTKKDTGEVRDILELTLCHYGIKTGIDGNNHVDEQFTTVSLYGDEAAHCPILNGQWIVADIDENGYNDMGTGRFYQRNYLLRYAFVNLNEL